MTEKKIDFEAYELPEPPSSLVDEIVSHTEELGSRGSEPARRSIWPAVAAGAVAVAVAAVVMLILLGDRGTSTDAETTVNVPGDKTLVARTSGPRSPILATDQEVVRVLPSASARAGLMRAIASARASRVAGPGPGNVGRQQASGGGAVLDSGTIKRAMGELRPLLVECYEMALERDPKLQGKVVVKFHIVGEPDVGGLVADVEMASADGLLVTGQEQLESEFAVCLRETVMSLELPAPEGGGELRVNYPFIFRPAGSDDSTQVPPVKPMGPSHRLPPSEAPNSDAIVDMSPNGQAKRAAQEGRYADALEACSLELDRSPRNQEAAMTCAISACNLKKAREAQHYLGLLNSRPRRDMARQICLRNGVGLSGD